MEVASGVRDVSGCSTIKIRRSGFALHIGIDRPQQRNALLVDMWQALSSALEQAGDARVLLLHGTAGAFCSGADLREIETLHQDPQALAASNALIERVQLQLQRMPIPTIALIDGACFGGGLGLALACDFRFATPDSRFGLAPARLGLMYSMEDTRRLHRAVGGMRARDMLMTGRVLDAPTALAWGVIGEIVAADALEAHAATMVGTLSRSAPRALSGIKRTLNHLEGDPSFDESEVRAWFADAFSDTEFREGLSAFFDKRKPEY